MKILKNLVLVDETHELNLKKVDILIDDGKIVDIVEEYNGSSGEITNYNGEFVSPGWIDLHVHVFENETDISIDADRIGVDSGVAVVCDAGSSGEANIEDFYELAKTKKTIIKSWINIASTGLRNRHELKDPTNVNVEKTLEKMKKFNDFIIGIKVRASSSVMGEDTLTPFEKAKEIREKSDKPIMVHIGNFPPTFEEVLSHLKKDDVITHCFHGKPGNILNEENKIKPYMLSKRKEGIKYDVGHGQDSFSYSVANFAKKDYFYPDSLSSDLHKYNLNGPVYSLANVVNKFLELGFELNEVINWVTINPAKMIKLDGFESLKNGNEANLTIFKIDKEKKELVDSQNEKINVNSVVKMVGVYLKGESHKVKYEN
ncbi:amidohydrolase/deacetylase family metallohydrolase [Helcococcus kunzii]|uniref:amidohydrolase/deacetylase family metallohydrolase n=1 Tax=Helcococcus kunzii TaxID=40091 RepID=UPI00389E81B8